MHNPIEKSAVEAAINRSFPDAPIPSDFFGALRRNDDIEDDIAEQFQTRKWTEISEHHWRMTGIRVGTVMTCMTPSAYIYYLPSLLISALRSNNFDDAVEGLIPPNQRREPRGIWWRQFIGALNLNQRSAIRLFLAYAVDAEQDGTAAKLNAEKALADRLYD
ncbi:hypothetical protein K9U39_17785 [Rhodoblastus acidophilus]|uniref:Uncharacterized protein n=1 Tax=Candidatus Rhodoblastus alkanivorans TaxID=2954117 RepID=A0ABS9Z243_9HYPH|nr:DUF6714 family protein [Candidatus Rhodoblastus alkanivorans]MCI4679029.1 hypothetical protein [Candidatus Rhodoblastus alkanivorans]MCI4681716.1 hypothetical protein [Candidatus Rhodoblastus alkanivorans]MDI4642764.1 hypothetical protein [Rhodoblastus acidophilus]